MDLAFSPSNSARTAASDDAVATHPLVRTLLHMCEAPLDAPDIRSVHVALVLSLDALADRQPAARALATQMREIPVADLLAAQAPSASVIPLLARQRRVATWATMREIGKAGLGTLPAAASALALATLGAAMARSQLAGASIDAKLVARIRDALNRPGSAAAKAWSSRAREQSLSSQLRLLEQAMLDHPLAARQLGLSPDVLTPHETPSSPAAALNAAIKRRMNAVALYAPHSLTRGDDGHGSLAEASTTESGRQLRIGAEAGDDVAVVMCLEIVTNLTPSIIGSLPLGSNRDARGIAPLAWIDIAGGRYCQVAWWLRDRGARPHADCLGLYVASTDIVSVGLPAFLHRLLLERQTSVPDAKVVGDLCAGGQHHPWRVAGAVGSGYRVSVRRLHGGVVSHLIGQDLGRLPVALITGCHSLVSKGRVAYGLVTQVQLDTAAERMHQCLDWGRTAPATAMPCQHYGSAVTPTDAAVRRVFWSLGEQVESAEQSLDLSEPEAVRDLLNALHAWLAALMALLLALRTAIEYPVRATDLQASAVHVDDKRVHLLGPGPALPVLPMLKAAVRRLEQRVAGVADSLSDITADHPVHAAVAALLAPNRPAVQWITAAWAVEPGGTDTWRQALPPSLRLVGNFGRHYWPHRLAARGIGQPELDILLRHSAADIESTSTATTTSPLHRQRRLVRAMEAELQALGLTVPRCLA